MSKSRIVRVNKVNLWDVQSGIAGPGWVCHHPELEKYCLNFSHPEASLTATELSDYCDKFKQEHGLMLLLDVLEHITECQAQAAGVAILDDDELDEMEVAYFTVQ